MLVRLSIHVNFTNETTLCCFLPRNVETKNNVHITLLVSKSGYLMIIMYHSHGEIAAHLSTKSEEDPQIPQLFTQNVF